MTVGLFGGTFDPPHLGHLEVSRCAHSRYGLDEVWWVCAYRPPHKPGTGLTPYRHRLAMTRLAVRGHPSLMASDIESGLPQPSYTVATLGAFQRHFPAHEFVLVMGQDSLAQFDSWRQPEAIADQARLLVYPRKGWATQELPPYLVGRIELMNMPLIALESVSIRSRVRANRSITSQVCGSVAAYIETNGLYRSRSAESEKLG